MFLISHADDLGLSPAIDAAIIQAAQAGHLTQVSCLVTHLDPATFSSYALPKTVECCLHFNITEGHPISNAASIPSLITKQGTFYSLGRFLLRLNLGLIKSEDVARELQAQLDRFKQLFGAYPIHIDSHQHIHLTHGIAPIVRAVAEEQGIQTLRAARTILFPRTAGYTPRLIKRMLHTSQGNHVHTQEVPDALVDPRYLTHHTLAATLISLPKQSTVEVIWHISTNTHDTWRDHQQKLITNPATWDEIRAAGITLVQYANQPKTVTR
jgi:predicted glycoside hydrolase/deacetylase ChbG (UPF0249 family)